MTSEYISEKCLGNQGKHLNDSHCKWKMGDINVMFVFKHIDQKPFCNDKIHFKFISFDS